MTDVSAGDARKDYTFGQILIKENLCSFSQVKDGLDIQNKLRAMGLEPKKLGDVLVEKGYITVDQAAYAMKLQTQVRGGSVGLTLPGLQILAKIGQGGMGAVYKARQISLDRTVAVKVLASKLSSDSTYVDRFVREARSVARLHHENIIAGIDVGEAGGVHYLVMEYVEGVPVSSVLKREGRIDERRCLEIGLQMAKALAHAHGNGIIHRDVKPENIMITQVGTAKLCDLGLARQVKEDVGITTEGTSVGTPNYISPEQARGAEDLDCRTDIYSLGASLYHMATGSPPFSGATALALMTQHVTAPVEPPVARNPALSDGFNRLVLRMMEKRREDRYQTPQAVAADIERLLRGEPPPAPSEYAGRGRADTPRPRNTRRAALASRSSATTVPALIVAAILVVAGVVAGMLFMGGPAGDVTKKGEDASGKAWNPPAAKTETGEGKETGALEEDIAAFRTLADAHIRDLSVRDRFVQPYKTILDRVAAAEGENALDALRAWEAERQAYKARANALIRQCVWDELEKKIADHFSGGRYAQALEEANRLEDDYKWFRRGEKPERTEAGTAHERWTAKITQVLGEVYVEQKNLAEQAFRDPAQRDEAYRLLDALAVSATPEQQVEIGKTRVRYIDADLRDLVAAVTTMEKWEEARKRIEALQGLAGADPSALRQLEGWKAKLADQKMKLVGDLRAVAARRYASFSAGALREALQKRDYPAARGALHDLLFGTDAAGALLLPQGADRAALKTYLDPLRTEPFEAARAAKLAMEADKAALSEGSGEASRSVLLDIHGLALLEDLIEQIVEGVLHVDRTPEKYQAGFSDALKDATRVEIAPAKPGAITLMVTRELGGGSSEVPVLVAPRGPGCLPENDMLALARRSYGAGSSRAARADADPFFAMKAFLLFYRAGQLSVAKGWLEKIPAGTFGLERYAAALKGQPSDREEAEAKKLFEEAQDLSSRKKDEARADRKFQECLDKYPATEYMKGRPTGSQKTRLEIARAWLQRSAGGEAVLPDPGGGSGRILAPGLEFSCFEGSWKEVPDCNRLKPYKVGVSGDFDLSVGGRDQNFAIWFSGYLRVTAGGTYTFTLASDDGSRLWIGTQEIVENDFEHPFRERTGTVDLAPGFHSITVVFFQGGGEKDLRVMWEGPQIQKKPVPTQALYHLKGPADR